MRVCFNYRRQVRYQDLSFQNPDICKFIALGGSLHRDTQQQRWLLQDIYPPASAYSHTANKYGAPESTATNHTANGDFKSNPSGALSSASTSSYKSSCLSFFFKSGVAPPPPEIFSSLSRIQWFLKMNKWMNFQPCWCFSAFPLLYRYGIVNGKGCYYPLITPACSCECLCIEISKK